MFELLSVLLRLPLVQLLLPLQIVIPLLLLLRRLQTEILLTLLLIQLVVVNLDPLCLALILFGLADLPDLSLRHGVLLSHEHLL